MLLIAYCHRYRVESIHMWENGGKEKKRKTTRKGGREYKPFFRREKGIHLSFLYVVVI